MRDQAALAIVFVSDEADCSFNRDLQNIVFGEEGVGNQVFWVAPRHPAVADLGGVLERGREL